jgi:hypothetical protein
MTESRKAASNRVHGSPASWRQAPRPFAPVLPLHVPLATIDQGSQRVIPIIPAFWAWPTIASHKRRYHEP